MGKAREGDGQRDEYGRKKNRPMGQASRMA